MTNGEKIIAVLNPRANQIRILGNWVEIEIQKLGINFSCGLDWWNAEYKKPTTKNDLGVDWDELKRKILMEVDGGTDDAWLAYGEVCNRISNSIDEFVADMREEFNR